MKKLILLMLIVYSQTFSQSKYTINGYVKDKETGESLISAAVSFPSAKTGVNTNAYGFYSITLDEASYSISVSYVGYKTFKKEINLNDNIKLDIELEPNEVLSEEVIVTARKVDENVKSVEMSSIELSTATIKKIPALLGEVDIIRSIQLLPGVSTVGEGATGFNVRGGGVDQNLVLLDEAPVYNQSHLFGFFSVFNPDAVKDVKLIKGGIPAQYGGRLSSILDVKLKEGNSKKFDVNGGIGTIFSRFSVEGPIIEDKLSFIVAGRRSYIDVLAGPFLQDGLEDAQLYFYDLTAKANWKIDDENTVYISSYFGRDVFGTGFSFNWGNRTFSTRWNHLFSDKLFSNLTFYYSLYDYQIQFGDDGFDSFKLESDIQTQGLKYDLDYFVSNNSNIKFGAEAINYGFIPGSASGATDGTEIDVSVNNRLGLQTAAYVDQEYDVSDNFTVKYGARFSNYLNLGPYDVYTYDENSEPGRSKDVLSVKEAGRNEIIEDFFNFEPRVSMKYNLGNTSSVKLGYNRMAQYIHLMSNTAAATPVDLWTTSSNNLKPQLADQIALGYFRNFDDNQWETSVEVYYKDLQNQVAYIDGANITLNDQLEADLIQGDGRTYGAEFYVKRTRGKLNGWVSYTLSRTERKIDGINNNDWYPARFDQTHKFNLTMIYDASEKWSFSTNFVYLTGTPITFPTDVFVFQGLSVPINAPNTRNQDRITDYHRLDLGATYRPFNEQDDWWKGEWVFSIYNVYNRRNAYSISPGIDDGLRQATRLSIIGSIVPSVTYNFNFDLNQVIYGDENE
ncbi:TonB-dependent receptor [Candidatus Kapabacteria bacterium]|nr:TonB-dependent receptor [Candidatus Kapabacteria bacterium]